MSENNEAKRVAWEAQSEDLKLLVNNGAQAYFTREFPDLKHAFLANLRAVVCMDEGTAHKDFNGEGKLCVAGSGILLSANSESERLEKAAEFFIEHNVKDITSHGGCGAAGLAYKRDFPDSAPAPVDIENYAIEWSRKLAEKINELGSEAVHTHILADDMERPVEFHIARVAYYDGVGGFNPDKIIDEPMGFVIERKFVSAPYAAEELKVAVNIAFGHHGFGELFTAATPFIVVVFASEEAELKDLKNEATEILKDNENFKVGKIKIDGVIVK